MSSSSWERPGAVPFPSVWRRCEGRRPLADGSVPRFRIQDVPEELHDAVVEQMSTHLLRDEPMCAISGLGREAQSLEEMQQFWRSMMKQRVGLVALLEGAPEGELPVVAGCNLLAVTSVEHKDDDTKFQGEAMKKVIAAMNYIEAKIDLLQHYGVTQFMSSMGLSVSPEFRGQGLGLELLRARFDLGRAVGVQASVSVFSVINSQILAARVGMEVLAEVDYDQYKVDGKPVFPGITTKSFKLMGKRIEQEDKDECVSK